MGIRLRQRLAWHDRAANELVVRPEAPLRVGAPPKSFVSSCYAPFTSLWFDAHGKARACCQNTDFPLGDVRKQSIRDIWDGVATDRLRHALREEDFSLGCQFCDWQAHERDPSTSFARNFDNHPVPTAEPSWPLQMEFSLTNACNLQCTMCTGEFSSAIRAHREHLPPLPTVYGDPFFEELAEFLPHLQKANFLGGEPLLGREPLRVLELMVDLGLSTEVAITTNGTQWSQRVERICEALNVSFVLSLDGITKSTYESIRVGADFERVMANLDRFQRISKRPTTTLAHCLMTHNWWEFADLLKFAEDRGLGVYVNVVDWPPEASLYRLKPSVLREVVEGLERLDVTTAASLTTLRPVWEAELNALRRRLQVLENNPRATNVVAHQFQVTEEYRSPDEWRVLVEQWAGGVPTWTIYCGDDDLVQAIEPTGEVLGVDLTSSVGQSLSTLQGRVFDALGEPKPGATEHVQGGVDTRLAFQRPDGPVEVRVVIVPVLSPDGDPTGRVLHIAQRPVESS